MTAGVVAGFVSLPVFASSSGSIRDLSRTTFRACPPPNTLKEHYTVFSAPHGESVQIACLTTPTVADWIFSAESECNDDNTECDPDLASPPEGMDDTGHPPRVITYHVSKYEVDRTCRQETFEESDGDNAPMTSEPFWSCKTYEKISKPVRIKTIGATTGIADIKAPALRFEVHHYSGDRLSGAGVVRDLSSTSVRACAKDRKLVEHYAARRGAYPFEAIELACLRTATSADWIFLAASECLDRGCVRKPLAVPANHKVAGQSSQPDASPRIMRYDAPSYAIGETCTLHSFETIDNGRSSDPQSYWACADYKRPDRSAPPLRVETTGAVTDRAAGAEGAPDLPLATTLGPDFFTTEGVAKDQ